MPGSALERSSIRHGQAVRHSMGKEAVGPRGVRAALPCDMDVAPGKQFESPVCSEDRNALMN